MANWCNFRISVSGPETARKELSVWLQSLPQSPHEKEIVVSVPDTKTDDSHDEWFYTTLDSFAVEEGNQITIRGDCKWDPPLRFVQVMFCRFSELTYDCTSTTEYVQSERWRFCTKYPSGRLLELKGGFGSGYTLEPGERPEFRENAYGFSLRFSGSVVAQSRVTEFVLARCEVDDDKHFIQHEHMRTYLWPEHEGVSATVIRQSNDQGELIIEGQDQATYGVTFAKELSEVLSNITIHVSAESPVKFSMRWDITNGQVTLVEYSGFIDFPDLHARSRYWLIKDGQALTRAQRKACVDEGLVSFENLMMEEWGMPSPLLHRTEAQSVIQKTIDSFEDRLASKLKKSESSTKGHISGLEFIELLDDLKAE